MNTENNSGFRVAIGNQTSQFLANGMLDPLDHFIKERLRIRGYLRYADDMLLFSDDKGHLGTGPDELRDFLVGFRLNLHPRKSDVFPVAEGIRFLGYRVFATHRILDKANVLRFRRRMRRLQRAFAAGRATAPELRARLISWMGHASHAKTFHLVRRLLKKYKFVRPRKQAEQAEGTPTQTGPGWNARRCPTRSSSSLFSFAVNARIVPVVACETYCRFPWKPVL